ncbi:spermidine/putrescine transport system substrate-binding protein [Catenulispora sp. MAP5-51]|uniref:polyamine ABC transporter substrate-binding protein n=1 Tax=Catenulispora sp. MAP5-51 TaxID=3156298 RepID=UPI003514637C
MSRQSSEESFEPSREPSRRSLLRAGAAGAVALTAAGCGFTGSNSAAGAAGSPGSAAAASTEPPIDVKVDGDLVYFNWADYVDPSVFDGFQKEYGVKVVQSNFDSMESMGAKLAAGNKYDIVFPSAKWTQRLAAGGKLHRIDHTALKNAPAIFDHYDYFQDPWYDDASSHSVPFTMYKTGIGWRKDKLGDLTGSWQDLWSPAADGDVFLLDDEDEVLGMAALKLGLAINTADAGDLAKIDAELKNLRPRLRGFSSDDYNNLLNGNALMTQAWSGDMVSVLNQAKDASVYGFQTAREGSPVNTDCYVIPANAEHPGTAMLFIDYMLRPENVTKNIEYIGYPMPVNGTEDAYAKLVAQFPQCVIKPEDLVTNRMFQNGTAAQGHARDAVWTDVKAG